MVQVFASSINIIPLAIAPGPQSIGIDNGVIEISLAYVLISSSFNFVLVKRACNISYPIFKIIKPAAIRKPLVDIPKNLNKNCPEKVKARSVIKEMIVARFHNMTPFFIIHSFSHSQNTGMVPNGLVNVKKEVKHSNANGNNVSIDVLFLGYGQK